MIYWCGTTADFIVTDNCDIVATAEVTKQSNYATGTSTEIKEMEERYYSYQAGYLKHLYRMGGYNQNFESYITPGTVYDTFYIKFNELDRSAYQWGDYIPTDSTVIIAVPTGSAFAIALQAVLVAGLGAL